MLRSLILHGNYDACRQMCYSHGTISSVYMLASGSTRTKSVNTQIFIHDIYINLVITNFHRCIVNTKSRNPKTNLLWFRHNSDRHRTSMDSTGLFSRRYTLYSVYTTFEFESSIDLVTGNTNNSFLVL